jgi:hypothetical protein
MKLDGENNLFKHSFLFKIFRIQDGVLRKNLEDFNIRCRTIFINKCLELINSIPLEDRKNYKTLHFILNDVNTVIICSIRLGLYGCIADAAAISRIALEHLAILDYAIDKHKLRILDEGLKRGFKKVKINYELAKKDIVPKIDKLYGKLSDLFSHSSKNRILYSGVHKIGRDCIGASLNSQKIVELLGHLCNLALYATRVMTEYLKKNHIEDKKYFHLQNKLEREYNILK